MPLHDPSSARSAATLAWRRTLDMNEDPHSDRKPSVTQLTMWPRRFEPPTQVEAIRRSGGRLFLSHTSETDLPGLKEAMNCQFHGEFMAGDVRHLPAAINGGVCFFFLTCWFAYIIYFVSWRSPFPVWFDCNSVCRRSVPWSSSMVVHQLVAWFPMFSLLRISLFIFFGSLYVISLLGSWIPDSSFLSWSQRSATFPASMALHCKFSYSTLHIHELDSRFSWCGL